MILPCIRKKVNEEKDEHSIILLYCYSLSIMNTSFQYSTTLRNVQRQKRARKKRLLRLCLLIVTIIALVTCSKLLFNRRQQMQVASVSISVTPTPQEPTQSPVESIQDPLILGENSQELGQSAQKGLEGTKGTYAIIVKKLSTGETYYTNEQRIFQTGSLYKLWVMATAYSQIKQGTLKETEVLKANIDALYKVFHLDASYSDRKEGDLEMTVTEALERMITISDNDAALLLTKRVGSSKVSKFLKDNEFIHSEVSSKNKPPITNTYDIALFFERLYKGKLIDQQSSEKMLTLLKKQRLNQKIPKYLPDKTVIAHKTGELDGYSHDAGIVYGPSGDYLFIMLSESNARLQANDRIALVSKGVYAYLEKLPQAAEETNIEKETEDED